MASIPAAASTGQTGHVSDHNILAAASVGVPLESFAGASDDARLGNALSYIAAQTYKPPLIFGQNRYYGPFTTTRTIFSGLKMIGSAGFGNQQRAANSNAQRLKISTSGAWLQMPSGSVFDFEARNLTFEGSSASTWLAGHSSGVLWTSKIGDCGWTEFQTVLGTSSQKLLLTACHFHGWWNINNSYGRAITIGGSDNTLWVGSNFLLDSPPAYTVPDCHMYLDNLQKSVVGGAFITAEQVPAAIIISGSNTYGSGTTLLGVRMEGRNENQPSYGSVLRITGGSTVIRDCWIAHAYSAPGSSGRSSEGGAVSVLGGTAVFDGVTFGKRPNGQADSTPQIYASGSSTIVRITNCLPGGGAWTSNLPGVSAVNGATVTNDASMRTL